VIIVSVIPHDNNAILKNTPTLPAIPSLMIKKGRLKAAGMLPSSPMEGSSVLLARLTPKPQKHIKSSNGESHL
jgi:hypothetical protein